MLERECQDCGRDLRLDERKVIDTMTIYHRKERRDLSAAARFYLDRDHASAHAAEADVRITADILFAQLERYDDLPRDIDELAVWLNGDRLDVHGKFAWKDGEVVFTFGKHRGEKLGKIAANDSDYCRWFLGADFRSDAKDLVESALGGDLPKHQA